MEVVFQTAFRRCCRQQVVHRHEVLAQLQEPAHQRLPGHCVHWRNHVNDSLMYRVERRYILLRKFPGEDGNCAGVGVLPLRYGDRHAGRARRCHSRLPLCLPECEPRATPLSTRSILRRIPTCSFTFFFFLLFFVSPLFNTENTRSKNRGGEDASSHPTHPWGPTLKKKSVAKAKIFFLLNDCGQPASHRFATLLCLHISEGSDRRSTYDRSELVCRRKSWEKNLAGTQPHARVPSPKFGETNCENPFACETSLSRARGPVLFHTKHTQNAKINLSRPPRMGVARGCGPHHSAF